MHYQEMDKVILDRLEKLNFHEKASLISYLELIPKNRHSHRVHRSKALKQIRRALEKV